MTSLGQQRKRKSSAHVDVIVAQVTFYAVVWTLLFTVTKSCRCGQVEHHQYPDGNNSTTIVEEHSERLEAIKADILGKLGVSPDDDLPSVMSPQTLPNRITKSNTSLEELRRTVMNVYQQSIEQVRGKSHRLPDTHVPRVRQFYSLTPFPYNDSTSMKIRASFSVRHIYIRFKLDLPTSDLEVFSESRAAHKFTVISASLKLLHRQTIPRYYLNATQLRHRRHHNIRVNVYQVLPVLKENRRLRRKGLRKRLVDSRIIDAVRWNRRMEDINLTEPVRQWFTDPSTNLGLIIAAQLHLAHPSKSVTSQKASAVDLFYSPSPTVSINNGSVARPALTVLGRFKQHRSDVSGRRRRSTASGDGVDCEAGETRCCRHPLWVSFSEIGWNQWILAPEGYTAYYCNGSCPSQHRVASRHANIQTLVHGVRPDIAPTPCCSPSKMSALPIAHLNADGRSVVSIFDDMIVDECMCS